MIEVIESTEENFEKILQNYKRLKEARYGIKPRSRVTKKRDIIDLYSDECLERGLTKSQRKWRRDKARLEKVRASRESEQLAHARTIICEVARHFEVQESDLYSLRRDKDSVKVRHITAWRLRNETALSMPTIGMLLGGRDHTTILAAVRKVDEQSSAAGHKNWRIF